MIKRRQQFGWSQAQAAGVIGISYKTLAAYEEARCYPPLDKFVRIIDAYKIENVRAFICGKLKEDNKAESNVVIRYHGLTPKEKKAVDVLLGLK